jgi:chlorosome envelope protein H
MATEELKKNAGSEQAITQSAQTGNVGKGDMAQLIGNMGVLIDSTIESVQGMINSAGSATGQIIEDVTATIKSDSVKETIESVQGMINSVGSATGQLIEGVTSTINSEPVQGIINNVNSVSGQLLEGVTATLKSEQVQNSFNELGKFWDNLIGNLNSTVNSDQVKNLFDNVSMGLGQLVNNVFSGARPSFGSGDAQGKKIAQTIPLLSSREHAASQPAPVQSAPAAPPVPKVVPLSKPGNV